MRVVQSVVENDSVAVGMIRVAVRMQVAVNVRVLV